MLKLLIFASLLSAVSAACPNSCSGHGTCGSNEVCFCFDNWGMGGQFGGDCSDRMCPYELAWVDAPDKTGATHQFAECAAKGICDRESGECECLAGYTGRGCGRQSCPDDCSGHGTCTLMSSIGFGVVWNDFYDGAAGANKAAGGAILGEGTARSTLAAAQEHSWDADRAQACVCDAGYQGINCVERMCPFGNDAMDTRANREDTLEHQVQEIRLLIGGDDRGLTIPAGPIGEAALLLLGLEDQTFALKFTSKMNQTATTIPIKILSGFSTSLGPAVAAALAALPNRLIDSVSVVVNIISVGGTEHGIQLLVTFDGDSVQGQQNILEVLVNPCGDGCTPLITGISNLVTNTHLVSSVKESATSDYQSYECGRRGKCDTSSGICSCFEGFTGDSCVTVTALV